MPRQSLKAVRAKSQRQTQQTGFGALPESTSIEISDGSESDTDWVEEETDIDDETDEEGVQESQQHMRTLYSIFLPGHARTKKAEKPVCVNGNQSSVLSWFSIELEDQKTP